VWNADAPVVPLTLDNKLHRDKGTWSQKMAWLYKMQPTGTNKPFIYHGLKAAITDLPDVLTT